MEAKVGAREALLAVLVLYMYNVCLAGEHTEHANMKFYYDSDSHHLVAATRSTCYMVKVTRDESDHAHTDHGIEDLEVFGLLCFMHTVSQAAHHHDHTIQDTMNFEYDPDSKYLIAVTKSTCYMVKLTVQESDHVHTDQGIEELQLKMVHDWLGKVSESKVYHDDRSLPHNIGHWCSHHDIFLLNRVLPVEPSHSSPFSTSPSS